MRKKRIPAVKRYKTKYKLKKIKNAKVIPLKNLREELDRLFSIFIRQRDCDFANGGKVGKCYTCDTILPFKNLQCGHFVSRRELPTRWDEVNCHAQCVSCNIFKHGNMVRYAEHMIEDYGPDILRLLLNKSRLVSDMSRAVYFEMIEYYKKKVSLVKHETNE